MEIFDKLYYVVIVDRFDQLVNPGHWYHLEKVFSKKEIDNIIINEVPNSFDSYFFFIVTNDKTLLNKYIFTINIDELKLLCGINITDNRNIRINTYNYLKFPKEVFEYFQKILEDEIISASEYYTTEIDYPFDGSWENVTFENFEGWFENRVFHYFKTPS